MKRYLLAAAVVAAGGSAHAADLAVKAPAYVKAPVAQVYDWTGFYLGINAGTGLDRSYSTQTFPGGAPSMRLGGLGAVGGGQVGYNWQTGPVAGLGSLVFGVEADFQGSGASDTSTCLLCTPTTPIVTYSQKLDWFGTVRGRVGLATGPVLSYLTGGLAYGDVRTTAASPVYTTVFSSVRTGWTVGSGVEAALGGNWTGRIEYLFLDLGTQSGSDPLISATTSTFTSDIREHVFRAALNYRLGAAGTYLPQAAANWGGFYAGGNFGGATAMNHSTATNNEGFPSGFAETFNVSPNGYVGGGQAGYNWQAANWVFGVEADFQGSSQRDDKVCVLGCGGTLQMAYDQKMEWFGTVRARSGLSVGSTLFYLTGGLAYGQVSTRISGTYYTTALSFDNTFDTVRAGYAVGAGIESPFTLFGLFGPNWTAKTEYLFIDLGRVSDSFTLQPGLTLTYSARVQEQTLRAGLNYHFNTPVVAKY